MSHELSPPLQSALLRSLWAGHASQRGRVLKALARLDEATLSSEPASTTFRRLLGDERDALCRGVGELIALKQLSAYTVDLVGLLRARAERREWSEAWLNRLPMGRAARGALVALVADASEAEGARLAALRVLRPARQAYAQSPASALEPAERSALLEAIANEALHAPLLRALGADAGEVDEPAVEAAIAVNRRLGGELYRLRHGPPSLFGRVFPPRASSLGLWPQGQSDQRPHLLGIARLAAAARSRRWLAALHEFLHQPGFGPLLEKAYREEVVREVAAPLLGSASNFQGEERAARTIEILGLLGERQAVPRLRPYLGPPTQRPGRSASAALLALARLGDAAAIDAHLRATLARLEHHIRGGRSIPSELGDPAPLEALDVGLRAATELGDARFAFPAFGLLAHREALPSAGPALPGLLARLQRSGSLGGAGLELLSRLKVTLAPPADQPLPTPFAQTVALQTALDAELKELAPAVASLAGFGPGAADPPTLRDAAAEVLAKLAQEEHAELLEGVLLGGSLKEAVALQLWERLCELRGREELVEVADRLLREGLGGRRAQEAALRWLGGELPPGRFLRLCLALVRSPHGPVRTRALREATARGLFRELPRLDDELPLDAEPAAKSPRQDLIGDLLTSAAEAFAALERDPEARRQVRIFLDALLPAAGRGPLDAEEARSLRRRLRTIGSWVEAPTLHAMHRELLEVAQLPQDAPLQGEEPLELGLCQALVLRRLAEGSFPHPHTGRAQRYWGPLPRFEDTWLTASPFVQAALFEVVASPAYLRTDSLVVRFLASPRAAVRRGALGLLSREACLSHPVPLLDCLEDPDPEVRRACVARLRDHELARHAEALRPLLRDPAEATRLLATRTLAEWGDPSCLEALTAFLGSEDDALRREAVTTLRGFDPGVLGGVLSRHVREETPRAAAAALAALRPDRLPRDPALGDAIFKLAAEGSGPLRARALSFLSALAEPGRLGELVPLLRDEEPSVRAAVADVLRRRDARAHAPAIAAAAVAARSAEQRLEILALLGDLGAPEAARELVPLLLAPEASLRAATRRALSAGRAFSHAPSLAALLERGLSEGASPEALAELVRFLDQTGPLEAEGDEPCAGATWASALRCEELGVWSAALNAAWRREPTPEARAQSLVVDRLEATLRATPAPSPAVLGRALREVERRAVGQRPGIRSAIWLLAERKESSALRRKALSLLAAWGEDQAHSIAARLAQSAATESAAQVKALEQERAQRLRKQPYFRGRVGTPGERRALTRAKGDLVAAVRVGLERAGQGPDAEFLAQAKALPAVVAGSRVLNAWVLRETCRRWAEDAGFAALDATRALSRPDPKRPAWQSAAQLSPPLRALLSLRDRLSPSEWLARAEGLPAAEREALADPIHLAALASRATGGAGGVDLPAWRRALSARKPAPKDWRARQEQERVAAFCLACMEHWRPELRELFPELVRASLSWHEVLPADRWSGKERQGLRAAETLARAALRLERPEVTPELVRLAGPAAPLIQLFRAACDDAPSLAEGFQALAGTSRAGERAQLCRLLAEVGDAYAARSLAERAGDDSPEVRGAVARAAWQVRGPARAPLLACLSRLWSDGAVSVRVEALRAAARVGHADAAGWTRAALSEGPPELAQVACDAARTLGLRELVPQLLEQLAGAEGKAARAAPRDALRALAEARHMESLSAALADASSVDVHAALGSVLRHLFQRAAATDAIGRALGAQLDAPAPRLPVVLGLLAEARHEPAAAALEGLLAHPEAQVRAATARASRALGLGRASLDAALAGRCDPALEPEPKVREAAFRSRVQRASERGERAAAWGLVADAELPPELRAAAAEEVARLGLPEPEEGLSFDAAEWALRLLIEALTEELGFPSADLTPLGWAERLGLVPPAQQSGGRQTPQRAAELLRAGPDPKAEVEGYLSRARRSQAGPMKLLAPQAPLARVACKVLLLPGAERERVLGELLLLRALHGLSYSVAASCLRLFPDVDSRALDLVVAAPRAERAAQLLALSERDPALALRHIEGAGKVEPLLRATLLGRALAKDSRLAADLRELLLATQGEVRWCARVGLDPTRRESSPTEAWPPPLEGGRQGSSL